MAETNENMELTAGQMLRIARTTGRRKRELGTIARTLCIREEFLDALENDDFSKIPELVYVLGFARNYAMELDMDPYMIIEKIKRQMGIIKDENDLDVDAELETGEPAPEIMVEPMPLGQRMPFGGKSRIFLTILTLTAVLITAILMMSGQKDTETSTQTEPAAVTAEMPATRYNMPVHREYGLKNRDYAQIVLQATGTTWIQVKNASGAVTFEHSMVAGDVYYALNGSTATIGNAGALDIWVNGAEIPKIGAEHQRILDLQLTPESLVK